MSEEKASVGYSCIFLRDNRKAFLDGDKLIIVWTAPRETKTIVMGKESAIDLANWILRESDRYE